MKTPAGRSLILALLAPLLLPLCLSAARPESLVPVTRTLYVPTSASIHGNAGAFFHTDLWAFNRSFDSSLSVSATYRCFTGPCSPASSAFVLAPRESKIIPDVVVTLFGMAETAGAIELTYTSSSEDLAATTRTYTPNLPFPTNGTAIPALTLADSRTRALFLGLGSNGGDLTSGFRANAGAYNPGPYSTLVTYTLLRADGAPIGSASQFLSSAAAGQVNDIFLAVGAGSTVTTNAVLVVTSELPVFPFVTVVDNQSGDSVYATPLADQPASPATSPVVNGGFDTGLGAWTNPAQAVIPMTWSPTDASGNPSSGSVLVTNTVPFVNGGGNGPRQCVPVAPGSLATFSVRMRVPSGQSGTASVNPVVYLYTSSDCTGTNDGQFGTRGPSGYDAWETQSATTTVPANIHSAQVILWSTKTSAGGTSAVYFDDVSLVTSPR